MCTFSPGRIARHLVGLLVLLATAAILAWRVDLQDAVALLDDVSVGWAAAGIAAFGLSKLMHAVRWRTLLEPFADPPAIETINLFLFGNLVNGLIPLRAGDVVRVQMAARRLGVPRAQMTASVFVVETLFDGLAFAGLLSLAVALGDVPGLTRGLFLSFAGAIAATCVAAAILGGKAVAVGELVGRLPFPGSKALGRAVSGVLDGLRPFNEPGLFALALTLAIAGWLLEAAAYAFLGEAFGLNLDLPDYLVVMVAANLLTALPLTPLGYGVYELGLQEVVSALGLSAEIALAYVLGSHLLYSSWILFSGLAAALALPVRSQDLLYLRGET